MKTAFIGASLPNTLFASVSVVTKAPMEECGSPLARKVSITMFVAGSRYGRHGPVKPNCGATAAPETKQECVMKFVDPDKKFPNFKNYLLYDFGKLASNTDLINGMKKWGKMSGDQARSYLIPGSGPKIIIVDDNDPLIMKPIANFPYTLNLGFTLVNNFESTAGKGPSAVWPTGNGKKLHRVGLRILQNLISGHLSVFSEDPDDRDSTKVLFRLDGFEQDVYGGVSEAEVIHFEKLP